jgi:hypothetical protein
LRKILFYENHFFKGGEIVYSKAIEINSGWEAGGVESNFVGAGGFEIVNKGCYFPTKKVVYYK